MTFGMCMRCEQTASHNTTLRATGPDGEPLPVVVRLCYNCRRRGEAETQAARQRGTGHEGPPPWRRAATS